MKFTANEEVFRNIAGLNIGVLILNNVCNTTDVSEFVSSEYAIQSEEVRTKFDGVELAEYPVIKNWRAIYKGFGEKKARSSVESLIRRVVNGKDLYNINPLVDIYNLASLKFEMPCGGEDLEAMESDLELTYATGNEVFIPLGESEQENPKEGEIIYRSGNTVVCRNFNYRESDITKLTEKTSKVIIVFEDFSGNKDNMESALKWIEDKTTKMLGASVIAKAIISETLTELEW